MKRETLLGIVVGAGAILAAPIALPIVRAVARPIVKAAFKQGMLAYERLRVVLAERAESLEDLFAEARAEAEDVIGRKEARAPRGDGGTGRSVPAPSRRPS